MQEEIGKLKHLLRSNDTNERINAINELGRMKSKEALNLLLDVAKKEVDINVRVSAIRGIGNQGIISKKVQEILLWNSRDTNPQVRRASIETLNVMNSSILQNVLLERLEDPDESIRHLSIDIMGNRKLKESTDALISLLKQSNDPQIIIRIAQALGKIQDPGAMESLFEKFSAGPPKTRPYISQSLQLFGEKPKDYFLRILSESNDIQLLQLSIGALQNINGEDVMEPIVKKLNHADQNVRNSARTAMINLKGSTKYVIKEFKANPQNTTIHEVLQNKGGPAVDYLIDLKDHEDNIVRTNANNILNAIVQNYQNRLPSGSTQHKLEATEVFLKLSAKNYPIPNIKVVKTHIINNLSFDDVNVQKISLRALRKFGDANAVDATESILQTTADKELIIEALKTLGEFQDSKPLESIKEKAKSDDVEIRKEAVVALGRIGEKNPKLVEDYFSEILYDPDPSIKLKAIRIATKLKTKKAVRPLKDLALHGPTDEIKDSASSALDNLQIHFIGIVSSSSSRERLIEAIDGLTSIGKSNEKVIEALFNVEKRIPDKDVRRKTVEALGLLGNERILERLDGIDISEPGVREAKIQAVSRIKEEIRKSETAIDRLRRGEAPDEDIEILRVLSIHDHNVFGNYATDIKNQLAKAVDHFEDEDWGECLNRINNVCEDIVKELFDKKRDEIEANVDALLSKDHWNRLEVLENRARFLKRDDPFVIALKQIHIDRRSSEAQHGMGMPTTKSNAIQAVHSLLRVYFKAEEVLG